MRAQMCVRYRQNPFCVGTQNEKPGIMTATKEKDQPSPQSLTSLPLSKDTKKLPYRKTKAVKMLELMVFTEKRKKYPSIPIDYLAPVTFRDDTANGLTKCITTFIQLMGGQAERISTTGRPIDRQSTFTDVVGRTRSIGRIEWVPGTTTKGSADISATIAGKSVKIEVKISRDVQSQAQKNYQQDVEQAGGVYYIARDFTSFLEWFNQTFKQ